MGVIPLEPEEARALVEAAVEADVRLPPGREFWFEVELASGNVVSGQHDTNDEKTLTLLDARTPANERRTVEWDAVQRISVTGHT